MFELLESRLHMSVTQDGNVVTVTGTDNAEIISCVSTGVEVWVEINGTRVGTFADSEVTRVIIKGLGGDDNLQSNPFNDLDVTIYGGKGNDLIGGGDGDDILRGGPCNDLLTGRSGSDKLFGGTSKDKLFGGLDFDILRGQRGADILANDGVDELIGGPGVDSEMVQ